MANSPRDGRSGSRPLDTDQAERLAELFQPSWEVGSGQGAASPPQGRTEQDKFGSTTAPEVPVPAHKKTLVGLPVPTPVLPASKVGAVTPQPAAVAAAAEAAAKAASKRTLMGVAPPAVERSTARSSQPPPVKVPSHAPPPPPPPPPPADLAETRSWAKSAPPASPRVEAAAKSSPRSSRPSGVAKAYVPKEDAHTPAVVVDEAALRDGEAAAAAEDARRRARLEAARHAKTMRARPGELGFEREAPKKSRALLWVLGTAAVGVLGIGGFLALKSAGGTPPIDEEPAANAEARGATPAEPIPTVASPEALPVEGPSPAAEPAAAAPQPIAEPQPPSARQHTTAEARPAKPQPAPRQNAAAAKRSADAAPSRPAQSEPKKTAEPQKKNVIVRDAPF